MPFPIVINSSFETLPVVRNVTDQSQGPWIIGGDLWALCERNSDSADPPVMQPQMMRSTDGGETWAGVDSDGAPTSSPHNSLPQVDGCIGGDGTTIYVFYDVQTFVTSGDSMVEEIHLYVCPFNTLTGTWGSPTGPGPMVIGNSLRGNNMAYRSAYRPGDNKILVLHPTSPTTISVDAPGGTGGNFTYCAAGLSFFDVESSSWSTDPITIYSPVDPGHTVDSNANPEDEPIDYSVPQIVMGQSNLAHLFWYSRGQGLGYSGGGSNLKYYLRLLYASCSATNTIAPVDPTPLTSTTWDSMGGSPLQWGTGVPSIRYNGDSTESEIILPYNDSAQLQVWTAPDTTSTTWTGTTIMTDPDGGWVSHVGVDGEAAYLWWSQDHNGGGNADSIRQSKSMFIGDPWSSPSTLFKDLDAGDGFSFFWGRWAGGAPRIMYGWVDTLKYWQPNGPSAQDLTGSTGIPTSSGTGAGGLLSTGGTTDTGQHVIYLAY